MKRIVLVFSIFAFLLLNFKFAFAYSNPGSPTGFVNDFAQILTPDQKTQLETKLSQYEQQTSNEISIVTIKSLNGDTVENFSEKLFQEWGIGKKDKDNGILLLVDVDDREVRIEVGYGLEGELTDAESYWIVQNQIIPEFKKGEYFTGISRGLDKIIETISGVFTPPVNETTNLPISSDAIIFFVFLGGTLISWLASILARSKSWWGGGIVGALLALVITVFAGFIFIGLVALILLVILGLFFDYVVSKSYKNHTQNNSSIPWWAGGNHGFSSGGGGGGFGGFGGGRSGGGGASGRW